MNRLSRSTALLTVAALVGCANADSIKQDPVDAGISKSFNAPYDRTVAATMSALAAIKIPMHEEHDEAYGHVVMVDTHVSAFSWGEVGRVIIKKSAGAPTTVVVDWSKRNKLQITGTDADDCSGELFSGIDAALQHGSGR